MTGLTGRRFSSVWPIWAWTMVAFGFVVTGIGVFGGVFARSLVLDLISFWPGLILVMLVAAALYPFHRGEWTRLAAVVPLLILTWLGSTIALHLAEWSVLPSAAADFAGPSATGIEEASLTIVTGGDLAIDFSGAASLYAVKSVRRGGSTPAARSFERVDGGSAQVVIDQRTPDTWFLTSGWRVELNDAASWNIVLDAASIEADLSGGSLSSLRLAGTGDVLLSEPSGDVQVFVDGRFGLSLPSGVAMVVTGDDVSVPAGWTGAGGEWQSPGSGEGYVVTVTSGASLVVKDA
ncbi:MAG TPA: hypothetical protein VLT15_12180 [Acidimicrobiia bacterium]|nr:hypothetical protein [Acidimicrobiia bacterium]